MNNARLVLISVAGLVLAGALGFGAFRLLQPPCGHSQAADLALAMATDPSTQKRIQELDAAFGADFGRACDQLCDQRARLSEKLITARADDPGVEADLAQIHAQQARMELMTWNHIVAVRDLLPAGQRAQYVRRVQADWARGQKQLRAAATSGQCLSAAGGSAGK